MNLVAPNLLDLFDVRVVAGRGFTPADAHPMAPAIIVDYAFADRLASGGNVLGRRIRSPADASEPNPWMEIVGVVPVFSNTFSAPGNFDARRVLMGIFGRASAQIGAGVAAGLAVAAIFEVATPGGNLGGNGLALFPVVVAVMFAVGLLAAAGPARRGLTVQQTEALRNE